MKLRNCDCPDCAPAERDLIRVLRWAHERIHPGFERIDNDGKVIGTWACLPTCPVRRLFESIGESYQVESLTEDR